MTNWIRSADFVNFQVSECVARVTLNRPEKRNALHASMLQELHDAILEADDLADVNVIIPDAAGKKLARRLGFVEHELLATQKCIINIAPALAESRTLQRMAVEMNARSHTVKGSPPLAICQGSGATRVQGSSQDSHRAVQRRDRQNPQRRSLIRLPAAID